LLFSIPVGLFDAVANILNPELVGRTQITILTAAGYSGDFTQTLDRPEVQDILGSVQRAK
jgi:hypothetical protein